MMRDLDAEWLGTDGLGGFASGTVGLRRRRYHALLVTATPAGRIVLLNGIDVLLDTAGGSFALSAQHYLPDVVHPNGLDHLHAFLFEIADAEPPHHPRGCPFQA